MKKPRSFAPLVMCCALLVVAATAMANPSLPAGTADGGARKWVYAKDCTGCSARICTRDSDRGHDVYGRADTRAAERAQPAAAKEYCVVALGSGYFPAEEDHIAAYLNKQNYNFE